MAGQPKHDRAEVLRLFEETGNQHEVARQIGCLPSTVSKILIAQGVRTGRTGRPETIHLPREEIVARYLEGEPCRMIAESYNVDPEVVRMRLRRWHIRRRVGGVQKEEHPFWKGGHKETMHYYRRQAYEVAAICLGQPLPQGMILHHLDEDPKNNNPSNLVVFPSQGHHARFHLRLHNPQSVKKIEPSIQAVLESGGHSLPQPPVPIQLPLGRERSGPSRKMRSPKSRQTDSEPQMA